MAKILIFGEGYLGKRMLEHLPGDLYITSTDIADHSAVATVLDGMKPDVIVNCAAKIGRPNIDWCESNPEETIHSNVLGPVVLAKECLKRGIFMAHVGSGSVYQGDNGGRGFSEVDLPNDTGSLYGLSKVISERALGAFPVLQLRIRLPIDSEPGPKNLITKLVKYRKVISAPNSVTVVADFLEAAKILIERRKTGIYNVTNPGAITHQEILDLYKEIVDPGFSYEVMGAEELSKVTKAGRSNCILSTAKLASEGVSMRPVKEAVRETLAQYAKITSYK